MLPWCRFSALLELAFSKTLLGLTVALRLVSAGGYGLLSDGMFRLRTAFISQMLVASVHSVRVDSCVGDLFRVVYIGSVVTLRLSLTFGRNTSLLASSARGQWQDY